MDLLEVVMIASGDNCALSDRDRGDCKIGWRPVFSLPWIGDHEVPQAGGLMHPCEKQSCRKPEWNYSHASHRQERI